MNRRLETLQIAIAYLQYYWIIAKNVMITIATEAIAIIRGAK